MPADLRRHARYPETLFRVQAEIYRTYHMLDPQAFYNKEDIWDLARYTAAQQGQPEARSRRLTWWPACPARVKPSFC